MKRSSRVDGGAHWALIPRPLKKGNIESVSFVSPTTGYVVSLPARVLHA